ncbi:MAG: hypothetical protein SGCHY_004623 [Lobulomycetales sp.]
MDCLPYIDAPADEALVAPLLRSETLANPSTAPRPLPPVAPCPPIKDAINLTQFDLLPPPSASASASASIHDWKAALDNSRVQLQAQALRMSLLKAMHAANSNSLGWSGHILSLQQLVDAQSRKRDALRKKMHAINSARRSAQLRVAETLSNLKKQRDTLIRDCRSVSLEISNT